MIVRSHCRCGGEWSRMSESSGEVILYRSEDGESVVQLRAAGGTVWLTREQTAELYGTTRQNISQIVTRVLADGEVDEASRNSEFLVRQEGHRNVRRRVDVYNLDMVLAVGYRVTTPRARKPGPSSPRFRTSCSTPSRATRRPSSSQPGATRRQTPWDSPRGRGLVSGRPTRVSRRTTSRRPRCRT